MLIPCAREERTEKRNFIYYEEHFGTGYRYAIAGSLFIDTDADFCYKLGNLAIVAD